MLRGAAGGDAPFFLWLIPRTPAFNEEDIGDKPAFTSDNGFLLGQHRFPGGKAAVYEESIRVPLLVRGPGVAAGRRPSEAALNIDLAATFAEIAQATPSA